MSRFSPLGTSTHDSSDSDTPYDKTPSGNVSRGHEYYTTEKCAPKHHLPPTIAGIPMTRCSDMMSPNHSRACHSTHPAGVLDFFLQCHIHLHFHHPFPCLIQRHLASLREALKSHPRPPYKVVIGTWRDPILTLFQQVPSKAARRC